MANEKIFDQTGGGVLGIQKPGHVQRVLGDIRYRLAYVQGQLDALEQFHRDEGAASSSSAQSVAWQAQEAQAISAQARTGLASTQIPRPIHITSSTTDSTETATCRPRTSLPLFPKFPGGPSVFTDYSAPPSLTQEVGITFYLNPSHLILPFGTIPGCTRDAMYGLPSLMQNVYAYSDAVYILEDDRVTQILFGVVPADSTKSLVFGFRIKYEENAALTNHYNPKKISGQVTVPKPHYFSVALEPAAEEHAGQQEQEHEHAHDHEHQ